MAPPQSPQPLHVVVAGGGAAAAELLLALRAHAGRRVRLSVIAPQVDAVPRVRGVAAAAPQGSALHARARSLRALATAVRADLYRGRVATVDARRHAVVLTDGRRVDYDALVLAVGARRRVAYLRAQTYFGQAEDVARGRLIAEIQDGWAGSIAFVVPPGATWPLPLYELAIRTRAQARSLGLDTSLRVITTERAPLELFGERASVATRRLLDRAGVAFCGATPVVEQVDGRLREGEVAGGRTVPEERVIALPLLEGPALAGTPHVAGGFLPTDEHGAVRGMVDVFAAGAATAFPVRQADLACQQAAAVAETLAQRAGAPVVPRPWQPIVRGRLPLARGRALELARAGAMEVVVDAEPAPRECGHLAAWLEAA